MCNLIVSIRVQNVIMFFMNISTSMVILYDTVKSKTDIHAKLCLLPSSCFRVKKYIFKVHCHYHIKHKKNGAGVFET